MEIKLLNLLLIIMLLDYRNTINWQGTGNMSRQNLTQIWNYIDANFNLQWVHKTFITTNNTEVYDFTKGLSDHLNTLWKPAWNVFVMYSTDLSNYDSVLYGYAFRDHWMWKNGVQLKSGYYVGFIIWKDYNCFQWIPINPNSQTFALSSYDLNGVFIQNINNVGIPILKTTSPGQIWEAAWKCVTAFDTAPELGGAAFTSIVTNTDQIRPFGHFCGKGYVVMVPGYDSEFNPWGFQLLLHIR